MRVYLSPTGSDTNSGLSTAAAVKTLERAEAVIRSNSPTTDVEVRIAAGLYSNANKTSWNTYLDDHKISFLPTTYNYTSSFSGERPVFRAPAHMTDGASWFNAAEPTRATRPTEGLHFYYLEVRNYASGMSFSGGVVDPHLNPDDKDPTIPSDRYSLRYPASNSLDYNSLYGMKFQYLGDRYNWNGAALTPGSTAYRGTHAIALRNSNHNSFRNNHFLDLVGVEDPDTYGADAEIIHAFYIKDGSTDNRIESSNFQRISGSPVKIRNDASGNIVTNNRFYRSGTATDGIFYDRVENFPCTNPVPEVTTTSCDTLKSSETDTTGVAFFECPSHGNFFTENTLDAIMVSGTPVAAGYDGNRIPVFKRSPYGTTQVGKAGCSNNGEQWLTTKDNIYDV